MNRADAISKLQEHADTIKAMGATSLYMFGSMARDSARASSDLDLFVETFETLYRPWNIEGQSVRPFHRMVAHTGFITVARRVVPEESGTLDARLSRHQPDVGDRG